MFANKKFALILCICTLLLSGCSVQDSSYNGYMITQDRYNEAEYSVGSNWQYAKALQADGRYELAKEYLLIALSAAQTVEEQKWLERELYAVDLQIKSRR